MAEQTCFGCIHLRQQGELGVDGIWYCTERNQKRGEDTRYTRQLPQPVDEACWTQSEPEEEGSNA